MKTKTLLKLNYKNKTIINSKIICKITKINNVANMFHTQIQMLYYHLRLKQVIILKRYVPSNFGALEF